MIINLYKIIDPEKLLKSYEFNWLLKSNLTINTESSSKKKKLSRQKIKITVVIIYLSNVTTFTQNKPDIKLSLNCENSMYFHSSDILFERQKGSLISPRGVSTMCVCGLTAFSSSYPSDIYEAEKQWWSPDVAVPIPTLNDSIMAEPGC